MLFCYIFPLHLYLEVWSGWQRGPLYSDCEEESDLMWMVELEGPWLILPLRSRLSHVTQLLGFLCSWLSTATGGPGSWWWLEAVWDLDFDGLGLSQPDRLEIQPRWSVGSIDLKCQGQRVFIANMHSCAPSLSVLSVLAPLWEIKVLADFFLLISKV